MARRTSRKGDDMAMMFARGKKETPETAWRKTCIKALKLWFGRNMWHYRTVAGPMQRLGVLDDFFIICGIPVMCEFKRPDGKYSRATKTYLAQSCEIDAIVEAGGRAGFVDSWEALEKLVDGIPRTQLGIRLRNREDGKWRD